MKRALWPWFVAGFLLAFFSLAFFKTVYFMAPSGQAVIRSKLWRFYLIEWPELFRVGPQALGPATQNQEEFLNLASTHVAASIVAGTALVFVVWCYRRIRRKEPSVES